MDWIAWFGGRVLVVSVEGSVMIIHGQDHGISSY